MSQLRHCGRLFKVLGRCLLGHECFQGDQLVFNVPKHEFRRDHAGARGCENDDDLYSCPEQAGACGAESGGWVVAPRGGGFSVFSELQQSQAPSSGLRPPSPPRGRRAVDVADLLGGSLGLYHDTGIAHGGLTTCRSPVL